MATFARCWLCNAVNYQENPINALIKQITARLRIWTFDHPHPSTPHYNLYKQISAYECWYAARSPSGDQAMGSEVAPTPKLRRRLSDLCRLPAAAHSASSSGRSAPGVRPQQRAEHLCLSSLRNHPILLFCTIGGVNTPDRVQWHCGLYFSHLCTEFCSGKVWMLIDDVWHWNSKFRLLFWIDQHYNTHF